ncbi:MAG: ABC transporter, permease protein 1 (cluster 1, maltose/g3p/polyamine/iron) [uncultured Thermomicrobiales bacterium]|uniref:ABC transporter, permease protein 1 (Cluster 1, maltose/g3p/polyamine/iron) n=1 Tax=uncultured Thermomicrobiales bacterium TaxID=1645740 RepID=A0A6J4USJ9_9BACT|nr:MAG: ABC transporter, permease protein 1 (cluster 1, maltose/g3p/polyamine/iron) [uncultured Thermomicrobiales bacterium]
MIGTTGDDHHVQIGAPPERADASARARHGRWAREQLSGWGFLLPALAVVGIFTVIPIGFSLWLSFYRWDMMRPNRRFLGFDNVQRLVTDDRFWNAVQNTLLYVAMTVPASIALAFGAALLLNRKLRGRAIFRTLFFAPVVTSTVAISFVWTWIYHPEIGLLNSFVETVGGDRVGWLTNPSVALFSISVMSIWKNVGYVMVLFLAGLQQIPDDLYGAARVDGAGGWALQRDVTIPMLRPTLFFIVVVSTIDATQVFTQIDVMTQGGPAQSTEALVYYLYFRAFRSFEMGYASTIAWALFLIVIMLTLIQNRLIQREDVVI